MPDLELLFKFVRFTHKFSQLKRTIYATGEDRRENDSEHSYQIAMCAWYIISAKKLDLNIDLCLKYALVHDLVEIYAGDTYFYTTDQSIKESKQSREADALNLIEDEFPEFSEMWTLIHQYESRNDAESKFIYAVDKLIAPINVYFDNGKSWHADGVTLRMLLEGKTPKIAVSDPVREYWDEFIPILQAQAPELFPQDRS